MDVGNLTLQTLLLWGRGCADASVLAAVCGGFAQIAAYSPNGREAILQVK